MAHYRGERNHQGLNNCLIQSDPDHLVHTGAVERRERLGGTLNYYYRAAASRESTAERSDRWQRCFAEEKPAMLPLPLEPFRSYQFGERTVHLDGCVEVEAAYYSVPPGWISRCRGASTEVRRS